MQLLAHPVIARGGSPEAISQNSLCILPFGFCLLLLSNDVVTDSSLRIIFLALKGELKLVQGKGGGIDS
jgi:hypothetical protein